MFLAGLQWYLTVLERGLKEPASRLGAVAYRYLRRLGAPPLQLSQRIVYPIAHEQPLVYLHEAPTLSVYVAHIPFTVYSEPGVVAIPPLRGAG